jgi:hypothetical protein
MTLTTLPGMHDAPSGLRAGLRKALIVGRVALIVLASLSIASSLYLLGLFAFNPSGAEEFTVGLRPSQFYRIFENEERAFPDPVYTEVFGVAHNSGGSIDATLEAIAYGADVIEVDVISMDGELYSAHTPPIPFLGSRWFRGPGLERVWTASYRADAMQLDLKERSPRYVNLVVDFLVSRPGEREVMVSSRSPEVLTALAEQAPNAILLLSVPDEATLEDLRDDPALASAIDGVSIRESVIDFDRATWLTDNDLLIFTWTVNDIGRVNELIPLGVDGITTENLALMTLMGGQERREQEVEG